MEMIAILVAITVHSIVYILVKEDSIEDPIHAGFVLEESIDLTPLRTSMKILPMALVIPVFLLKDGSAKQKQVSRSSRALLKHLAAAK